MLCCTHAVHFDREVSILKTNLKMRGIPLGSFPTIHDSELRQAKLDILAARDMSVPCARRQRGDTFIVVCSDTSLARQLHLHARFNELFDTLRTFEGVRTHDKVVVAWKSYLKNSFLASYLLNFPVQK